MYCYYIILFFFIFYALGSPIEYSADETTTSTTLTTMQQKLRHTFNAKDNISYLVEWTAEIHATTASDLIQICLELDDTTVYNQQNWHPSPDVSGGWAVVSGFVVLSGLSVGSHDIDIDYASGTNGQTVSVRRTRLYVTEVNV